MTAENRHGLARFLPRFGRGKPEAKKSSHEIVPRERQLDKARSALESVHNLVANPDEALPLHLGGNFGGPMVAIFRKAADDIFASGALSVEVTEIKMGEHIRFQRPEEDITMIPQGDRETLTFPQIDDRCRREAQKIGQEWTPLFPPETPLKGE